MLLAAFGVATVTAKLFGAGWGTAASFGQIAFTAMLAWVLLRVP